MTEKEILAKINAQRKNTLMETLEIEFTRVGDNFVEAKMPVNSRVHQPDGVLHGGATVALAETVGSVASFVLSDKKEQVIRGIEISANHVKSISSGTVYARAEAVHNGRTTQLWDIRVTNENNELISLVKLTTISLPKK